MSRHVTDFEVVGEHSRLTARISRDREVRHQEAAESDLVTFVQDQGREGQELQVGQTDRPQRRREERLPCLGAQPSLFHHSFPPEVSCFDMSSFLSEPLVGLSVSEQGNKDSNRLWFGSAAQIVPECRLPSDGGA